MRQVFLGCLVSASLAAFVGCGGAATTTHADAHVHGDGDGHDHGDHPAEGPHHGDLIELGKEEYHAELIHDETTNTVAVYILDGDAKASVPIEAKQLVINLVNSGKPAQFALPAAPQDSDPAGKSSCFQLTDEKLCGTFCAEGTTGRINIEVAGKSYTGTLAHHDHHEHKHR